MLGTLLGLSSGCDVAAAGIISFFFVIIWPYLVWPVRENVPRLPITWPTLLPPTHPSSPYKSSLFPNSRRPSKTHTTHFHARTSCLPPQPTLHLPLPNHRLPHLHETNLLSWNLRVSEPGLISTPNSDERLGPIVIGLRPKTLATNARRSSLTWRNVWQSWRKRTNDCEQAWASLNSPPLTTSPSASTENRYRHARTESSRRGSRA